jgi:hypothetical protein
MFKPIKLFYTTGIDSSRSEAPASKGSEANVHSGGQRPCFVRRATCPEGNEKPLLSDGSTEEGMGLRRVLTEPLRRTQRPTYPQVPAAVSVSRDGRPFGPRRLFCPNRPLIKCEDEAGTRESRRGSYHPPPLEIVIDEDP